MKNNHLLSFVNGSSFVSKRSTIFTQRATITLISIASLLASTLLFLETNEMTELSFDTMHRIPDECTAYIQSVDNQTVLNLRHGQYIYSQDRIQPYNVPCFIMKHRYNCLPPNSTTKEVLSHQWHFVLQSNLSDISTLCDLTSVVDRMGGPAALPRDRSIGLMGNSYLRQLFESLGCKYKQQLSKLLLHQNGPTQDNDSMALRKNRPYNLEEYGSVLLFDTNDKDKVCFAGLKREDLQSFYSVQLPEEMNLVQNCTDNIALAEYNKHANLTGSGAADAVANTERPTERIAHSRSHTSALSVFYNFRPHNLNQPNEIYDVLLGKDVMQSLDTIFWNDDMKRKMKNKVHFPDTARWVDLSMLMWILQKIQRRDAGVFFRENNPWIAANPSVVFHPCMPGIPDDEIGILLFLLIFDIDGIVVE
ncbi:hypothetical protein HJC23_011864 [Cyclotella cryptica]|uniref:Uncharacterized protein n=1 Tax=Cyclotella cryptica TaxID=29204 RepID=A0ABD3QDT8_9STRA|eukprot:CCRYP_006170-RA/>CCRYP_006170-RA protein AED:0.43 eAED:0.43 QI:0/-1/0/1/-1/1/1/0/419